MGRWNRARPPESWPRALSASRTYVVSTEDRRVVAYYSLASGAVTHQVAAPRVMRIAMPDPVPVAVLGKLAVDRAYQNKGLGSGLLRDAVMRAVLAADIIGIASYTPVYKILPRREPAALPDAGLNLHLTSKSGGPQGNSRPRTSRG